MNSENLEERLDEFAETHGGVLLGMHKDLTTLKSEVAATLAKHSAEIQKKAGDIAAKQHTTLDEMRSISVRFAKEKQQILQEIQSKLDNFAESQDRLLDEANAVLDKTLKGQIELSQQRELFDSVIKEYCRIIDLELQKINNEAKRHQAEVDKFKKTTRTIAVGALALMIGVVVWLAIRV